MSVDQSVFSKLWAREKFLDYRSDYHDVLWILMAFIGWIKMSLVIW